MAGIHESWRGQVLNPSNHSEKYMESPIILESLGYLMRKRTQSREVL